MLTVPFSEVDTMDVNDVDALLLAWREAVVVHKLGGLDCGASEAKEVLRIPVPIRLHAKPPD